MTNIRAGIDVIDERVRQLEREGWDYSHDDKYVNGELIDAAICYAQVEFHPKGWLPDDWPWDKTWWKPKSPRNNLKRAAALLIAEIERIDRLNV